jgi:hypothetical protein
MHGGASLTAIREPEERVEGLPAGALTVIAVAAWLLVIVAVWSVRLDDPVVRWAALFVHLVSLAVGFGAVVVVDVCGALWVIGRRTAGDVVAMITTTHQLITAGIIGLLLSGAVLAPDLASPIARLKLGLVLAIMLNGVNAHCFTRRLRTVPAHVRGDDIPWEFVPRALGIGVVSQLGWWGAILIGFITTTSRLG